MEKDKNGISFRDIDSTLTDGRLVVSKGWFGVLIFFAVMLGLIFTLLIVQLISFFLSSTEAPDMKVAMVGESIAFAGLLILYAIFVGIYISQKKKFTLWLRDAVILNAKVEKAGTEKLYYSYGSFWGTTIKVRFTYDGHKRVRYSERKGKPRASLSYNKFVGEIARIAYSPKYDKVMLLNPTSVRLKNI